MDEPPPVRDQGSGIGDQGSAPTERRGAPLAGGYTETADLDLLAAGSAELGLPLTPDQLARFRRYYDLLVDWSSRMNLTSVTDPAGVQVRHFLDSLTVAVALLRRQPAPAGALPAVLPTDGAGLIDLGTGAGFPGLPLKILWPALRLTLVESVGKKTEFLRAVVGALALRDVAVLTERAEALGQDRRHRGRYDVVTARAVAPLPVLAEYGLPLCRIGGVLAAPKKGAIEQEIAQGRKAAALLGGGAVARYLFRLPGETDERSVLLLPKTGPTPAGYPRRVGLPAKRPLGTTT